MKHNILWISEFLEFLKLWLNFEEDEIFEFLSRFLNFYILRTIEFCEVE